MNVAYSTNLYLVNMSRTLDIEKQLHQPSLHHPVSQTIEHNNDVSAPIPESQTRNMKETGEQFQNVAKDTSYISRIKQCLFNSGKQISTIDPGPPPDGGIKAWTQVAMGHLVIFNTWGVCYSFGVFQQYYTQHLGLNPSAVSWIGSVQLLGLFCVGIATGRMFDAGIPTILPGMIISALSMFMTSLCTKYWQLFLAQGLLNGLGNGLQFAPTLSIIATYFSKHRSLAVALMASGGSTGGLVYPSVARQLIDRIGFAWTVRTMGFIMLAVGTTYSAFLRRRLAPRRSGPALEISAFKELPYSLFCIGVLLNMIGQFFAFYYISSFAINILHLSYSTSVNVLLAMNGIGIFGRLIPSYIADKYTGPLNVLICQGCAAALLLYFWTFVKDATGLYIFSAVYGFIAAGFAGIFPATLTTLTKDLSRVGTRNGQGLAVVGIGCFVGPPIAGALIQSHGGTYLTAQMFAGSIVVVGNLILVLARCSITGLRIWVRV